MRPYPKPQEMYRHFKGNIYQIRCLARHSETGELMVVYQAMYDTFQIYVRPLTMFMEEVDSAKYPDVKQKYRFELLQDMELTMPVQVQSPEPTDASKEQKFSERSETMEEKSFSGSAEAFKEQKFSERSEISERKESESAEQTAEADEQVHIDPLVMDFLDANTYEQRLNILAAIRHRVTDDMINTMAAAVELEIKSGDVEERYEELRRCLLTFEKYECNRLR